eukprot:jgi/Psemu1/285042/fgenesh1_pg.72_\
MYRRRRLRSGEGGAGFHTYPNATDPKTPPALSSSSPPHAASVAASVPVAAPSGTNDEFAAISDEYFLEVDDPTMLRSASTSTSLQSSPASSSSAAQVPVTREHQPSSSLDSDNSATGREESGKISEDSNGDACDHELDEEENLRLTLEQQTQEEVDFDAMFEAGDADDTDELECELPGDCEPQPSNSMDDTRPPKAMKQPTMSHFYSRETKPAPKAPLPQNFVEYNGTHYFRGDFWKLREETKKKKGVERSNLIVQIEKFTTKRLSESKRLGKVAEVKNKYHMAIKHIPYLTATGAESFVRFRKSKGFVGPEYVEIELQKPSLHSSSSSAHCFPLKLFEEHKKDRIESDLIFGFEKAGFFFQYKRLSLSSEQLPIPKTPEGKFRVLDLYAGAGGFSQGLREAGFDVSYHVDSDTASCSTLQANFPGGRVLQCSVEDFLVGCRRNPHSTRYPKKTGFFALLHGSSPCQGFSTANRNGGANDDANNYETHHFMEAVKHFQPPYVTFENVEGIGADKHKHYRDRMTEEFLRMDYQIRANYLDSSAYGDPQERTRFIILAAKKGLRLPSLPKPTHGKDPSLLPKRSARDALRFLENVDPLEYEGEVRAQVNGISLSLQGHKLKSSEPNKDDVFLVADRPARTVIKKRVIRHYRNNKRPLTRLERAQLQSFPPTYEFYGTDSEIRDQIGNAVPINLARTIGNTVLDAIQNNGGGAL